MQSNRANRETLTVAAHYLWAAAQPYDRTRVFLDELSVMVKKLEQHGPTVGLLERLSEAIVDFRDAAPVLCDVDVSVEGKYVVVRVGCVPEEHPVLIPE